MPNCPALDNVDNVIATLDDLLKQSAVNRINLITTTVAIELDRLVLLHWMDRPVDIDAHGMRVHTMSCQGFSCTVHPREVAEVCYPRPEERKSVERNCTTMLRQKYQAKCSHSVYPVAPLQLIYETSWAAEWSIAMAVPCGPFRYDG
jgi:hypothetical protein